MTKALELTGKKFSRLTVIKRVENSKDGRSRWLCLCECNTEKIVIGKELNNGEVRSCGCLHRDTITKHGMFETQEYRAWVDMKQRCHNEKDTSFSYYGGRGLTVCDRWRDSFENFYEDMGSKPDKFHTLDRIDNNGNYEPSNCRWASKTIQGCNRRKVSAGNTYKGVRFRERSNKWEAYTTEGGKYVHLGVFNSEMEAAIARDERTRELGYEEAWMNFPKTP